MSIASTAAASAAPSPTYVPAGRIYREHGVNSRKVAHWALAGLVRCRIEPGITPRYAQEDVVAILQRERQARSAS